MATPQNLVSLPIHYIKSNQFRVIHVDGAYGGLTSHGLIHVALYNERGALPRETRLDLDTDQKTSSEVVVDARQGAVRELEVDAIMSLPTAEALHEWLGAKIEELRRAMEPDNG